MRFVAIDVETANADMSSICQVGIAVFENGEVVCEWQTLINPEVFFSEVNVSIHGISESDVFDAPRFIEVAPRLNELMCGAIVVCHTHFDRISIAKVQDKYGLPLMAISWIDSAMVARRAWEQFSSKGYGLANLCSFIGYEFKHHDALEDAKASGQILLAAIKATGVPLEAWPKRISQPIFQNLNQRDKPNPDGVLFGEVACFTGSLEVARSEAEVMALNLGCDVGSGVTKKTTLLIVGDQDAVKLAGKDKSSKHIKAEKLISLGQDIRILRESDFFELINDSSSVDEVTLG